MVEFYGWPDTEALPEPEDVDGEAALVALLELLELDPQPRVTECDEPTERELSWKIRSVAYHRARKWTGYSMPRKSYRWSPRQKLVALLNGIDADVERYLESENPYEQAWILYERLYEIQRDWMSNEVE